MKLASNQLRRWTFAALVAVSPVVYGQESAGSSTPAATQILPDTFGTVVIGDVPGLLDKIGALASKVVPGVNADMIKQQAGAMLGDPQLAGLPAGSGIAVVIPKQGLPFGFIEVSADKAADYQKLLESRKMGQVAQAEGLLVAAADPTGLDAAKAAAGKVKSTILGGNGAPTLAGAVKLAEVLKQYDAQVKSGIASMSQKVEQADKASTGTTANAETVQTVFEVYYSLAKKIDTFELSLEPSAEAMGMNYMITPLQSGDVSPAVPNAGADMLKLIPGTGAIRGQANIDMAGLGKLMTDVMQEVGKSGNVDTKAIADWFNECANVFAGPMAMAVMTDQKSPISGAYALASKDDAAALKLFREMPEKLKTTGLLKLYEFMGMKASLSFAEKAREYKGVPIHKLTVKVDFTKPNEQLKNMQELLGNVVYDVAITKNVVLYAVEPEKIDSLIDAVNAGNNPSSKPLVSTQRLPQGGNAYFDYNIGAAMILAAELAGNKGEAATDTVRQVADAVKDAPPLQIGWYHQGTVYRMMVQMPAETIKGFVDAGKAASAKASSARRVESNEEESTSTSSSTRSSGPRAKQSRSRK
jgi:hypothetical protein